MPYNFNIAEVANKIKKSESDIRRALAKLLSKIRSGINTALDNEHQSIDERIVALNGGNVRILGNPDIKQ